MNLLGCCDPSWMSLWRFLPSRPSSRSGSLVASPMSCMVLIDLMKSVSPKNSGKSLNPRLRSSWLPGTITCGFCMVLSFSSASWYSRRSPSVVRSPMMKTRSGLMVLRMLTAFV